MIEATLEQLDLTGTPFPQGFVPAYCTKSDAEDYDGIWHVHESEPVFCGGNWDSSGQVYEVGIDRRIAGRKPFGFSGGIARS